HVGDHVLGQVEFRHVLALFQAGEVLDALAAGVEDEDVFEHLVGEVALGVEQSDANRRVEVLVGERRRGGGGGGEEREGEEGQKGATRHGGLLRIRRWESNVRKV